MYVSNTHLSLHPSEIENVRRNKGLRWNTEKERRPLAVCRAYLTQLIDKKGCLACGKSVLATTRCACTKIRTFTVSFAFSLFLSIPSTRRVAQLVVLARLLIVPVAAFLLSRTNYSEHFVVVHINASRPNKSAVSVSRYTQRFQQFRVTLSDDALQSFSRFSVICASA